MFRAGVLALAAGNPLPSAGRDAVGTAFDAEATDTGFCLRSEATLAPDRAVELAVRTKPPAR